MSEVLRVVHDLHVPLAMRAPIAYEFPRTGITKRLLAGIALLTAAGVLGFLGGTFWALAALLAIFGGFVSAGNLRALFDPEWRRITLDRHGVEIRYGFSRRRYGFLDYADYQVSPAGPRGFLTALPIEIEFDQGRMTQRTRVTTSNRLAFIAPMPPLGNGSPDSLAEWQAQLNRARHKALESARLRHVLGAGAPEAATGALSRSPNTAQRLWFGLGGIRSGHEA